MFSSLFLHVNFNTFNNLGIMDTILMKNTQNEGFYHITGSYPQKGVYIILGVICGAILGLVGINVYLKRCQKHKNYIYFF